MSLRLINLGWMFGTLSTKTSHQNELGQGSSRNTPGSLASHLWAIASRCLPVGTHWKSMQFRVNFLGKEINLQESACNRCILGQSHQHHALWRQDLDYQVECRRLSNRRRQEISAEKMAKLQVSMGWCNYGLTLYCLLTNNYLYAGGTRKSSLTGE